MAAEQARGGGNRSPFLSGPRANQGPPRIKMSILSTAPLSEALGILRCPTKICLTMLEPKVLFRCMRLPRAPYRSSEPN
jgi:hypothetical protein